MLDILKKAKEIITAMLLTKKKVIIADITPPIEEPISDPIDILTDPTAYVTCTVSEHQEFLLDPNLNDWFDFVCYDKDNNVVYLEEVTFEEVVRVEITTSESHLRNVMPFVSDILNYITFRKYACSDPVYESGLIGGFMDIVDMNGKMKLIFSDIQNFAGYTLLMHLSYVIMCQSQHERLYTASTLDYKDALYISNPVLFGLVPLQIGEFKFNAYPVCFNLGKLNNGKIVIYKIPRTQKVETVMDGSTVWFSRPCLIVKQNYPDSDLPYNRGVDANIFTNTIGLKQFSDNLKTNDIMVLKTGFGTSKMELPLTSWC